MLERLTGALAAFVDFLRLDRDLIVQAAQGSAAVVIDEDGNAVKKRAAPPIKGSPLRHLPPRKR
jgi:hypothetical protein